MNKLFLTPLLPLVLGAAMCSTPQTAEPQIVTVEVPVPTPAPCVPRTLAPPPNYTDTDDALKAAADAAERMALMYVGRTERQSRLSQLEPVIAACPRESQ